MYISKENQLLEALNFKVIQNYYKTYAKQKKLLKKQQTQKKKSVSC